MKLRKQDFQRIQISLLAGLLALGLSVAAVYHSDNWLNSAQLALSKADLDLTNALKKLAHDSREQEDLQRFYQQYKALQTRHVLGAERRLDWIEAIEKTALHTNISSMKYKMEPQTILLPQSPNADQDNFAVYASNMSLDLGLLHEQQLIDFLDMLRNDSDGLYVVKHCNLNKNSQQSAHPAAAVSSQHNLRASCVLSWLTLQEPQAGEHRP